MSYLVLHMDKFKKEAIRGIQSHNRRERESHSNPDIDYDRSRRITNCTNPRRQTMPRPFSAALTLFSWPKP